MTIFSCVCNSIKKLFVNLARKHFFNSLIHSLLKRFSCLNLNIYFKRRRMKEMSNKIPNENNRFSTRAQCSHVEWVELRVELLSLSLGENKEFNDEKNTKQRESTKWMKTFYFVRNPSFPSLHTIHTNLINFHRELFNFLHKTTTTTKNKIWSFFGVCFVEKLINIALNMHIIPVKIIEIDICSISMLKAHGKMLLYYLLCCLSCSIQASMHVVRFGLLPKSSISLNIQFYSLVSSEFCGVSCLKPLLLQIYLIWININKK